MDLEPILALWAGYYLDGEVISEADLPPYVDDAMNELEFLLVFILYSRLVSSTDHSQGSASTTYGSQRSALGYPDPFMINYIEIGNEDFFDSSGSYQSEI